MRVGLVLLLSFSVIFALSAAGQDSAPLISGGAGFVSTTNGGVNVFQPVFAPVVAVPLGDRFLIESRADLREVISRRNGNGPYESEFFGSLDYLQLDFMASSKATLSFGRYLTPFGIYNERVAPIWIRNFQDGPIIFPIGTRTSGSGNGIMLRGNLLSSKQVELTYAAYFSALNTVNQFEAGRAAGGRFGILLPGRRLELGASYQRYLQDEHLNSAGAYFAWQPLAAVDVKAEFARSPHGKGYWIEGAYRLRQQSPASLVGRLQLIARVQQFFGTGEAAAAADFLPVHDTNRVDAGFNYHLPRGVRANLTYGRTFSVDGNRNTWNAALTYRLPLTTIGGKR